MSKTVSEVFVETLIAAGVKRIYGVVGDSLNGITDTIRAERSDRVGARAPRRGGCLRRRSRGSSHRHAGGVRRQLRPGQSASHQRSVRLPSQSRARVGNRRANSQLRAG